MKMPLEKTSIVVVKLSGGRGFEAAASTNKEKTMREYLDPSQWELLETVQSMNNHHTDSNPVKVLVGYNQDGSSVAVYMSKKIYDGVISGRYLPLIKNNVLIIYNPETYTVIWNDGSVGDTSA